MDLRKGDVGYVVGRRGLWCISAGAPPPEGIFPCSQEARRTSENADPIAVWSPRQGSEIIMRDAFIPLHLATPEQRHAAMGQ